MTSPSPSPSLSLSLLISACCISISACCISSSPPPSTTLPPAPPPSSPEQPIGSPGACRGDDRSGMPLATSDFVSTLPLAPARAYLDDWNEWCPDTWCEGSFNWYAYDLRGDAARSEITLRAYALQRAPVPSLTDVRAEGEGFSARVLAQRVVPSCIVPCLGDGVYEPSAPCLVLDVRIAIDAPADTSTTPEQSRWDTTLVDAGIAIEEALRDRVPEDYGE